MTCRVARRDAWTCREQRNPGRRRPSKTARQLPLKFEVVYIMSGLLREPHFMNSQLPAFVCIVLSMTGRFVIKSRTCLLPEHVAAECLELTVFNWNQIYRYSP